MSRRGYGISKDALTEADLDQIRRAMTAAPNSGPFGPAPPQFRLYRESASKIYIPKAAGLRAFGAPGVDKTPPGDPMAGSFTGELRESQIRPVEAFLAAARDPTRRGGIINMSCAAGKTVMGIFAACRLGLKTLIVVHKDFLARQWEERIAQFAPNSRVGRIQGAVFEVEGNDFVIGMVQTLSSRRFDEDAFDSFGTVVVDECHHMSAQVFSRALHGVNFRHALGLSATLTRADGLSHVFQWFVGDVVHRSAGRSQNDTGVEVVVVRPDRSRPAEDVFSRGGVVNTPRIISDLCSDDARTASVARAVARALTLRPGARVLVLSDRRSHLEKIRAALADHIEAGRAVTSGYYVGGMKNDDLRASAAADVVFGTFAMAAEGMDIPSLDTLVLASPKGKVEQPVGRILRVRPEHRARPPLVIDVADDSPFLKSLASRRAAFYAKRGYAVRQGID